MYAAGIGVVVIGIVLALFIPWVGVPLAVIGALLLAYGFYAAKQAADTR